MGKSNISIDKIAGGAIAERINLELEKVLKNIRDPNTDYKKKRKLTLELTFTTGEDRELASATISTKVTLAPAKPVVTSLIIGTDGNGNVIASEINKQIAGQTYMEVDEETGEIKSNAEEQKPTSEDKDNVEFKLVNGGK